MTWTLALVWHVPNRYAKQSITSSTPFDEHVALRRWLAVTGLVESICTKYLELCKFSASHSEAFGEMCDKTLETCSLFSLLANYCWVS